MSNLGDYQVMTRLAKKLGGPKQAAALCAAVFIGVGSAATKGWDKALAWRSSRQAGNTPCVKDEQFKVHTDGEAGGLRLHAGSTYRVLECDGDAILIEVLDDPKNPYFAAEEFLRSVSDFPGQA